MSSVPNVSGSSDANSMLKRKSNDVGWEFGQLVDAKNLDRVKCNLCGKTFSGGVYRLKEHVGHIKGNVASCTRSTKENIDSCRKAIEDGKNKKRNKRKEEDEIRAGVNISGGDECDQIEGLGRMKGPNFLGPMDKFAKSIDSCSIGGRSLRQQNINESLFKERTSTVQEYVAQWVYEAGISFNAIDNDSFKRMVQAVGVFGPGFKPPSPWQLRETLLKKMVEKTHVAIKNHEEEWKLTGCSIMTDAWTDRKRRSIMNLCVNCREGTTFLSSKECSDEAHTGEFIFRYVLKAIQQVGAHNVVQIVTDNASNNMAATKLLKDKMPHVFWSSCATHTINLMLESIGKLPKYKKFIDSAKAFTIFVYAHHKTLSLMRSFTKKRDIVRPGVTRFASSFLSLESLVEKKDGLRQMFTSGEWEKCKWANTVKGREAYSTMVSLSFWNGVNLCLKVFGPLVKVLRLVDGDRKPSMAFLYGELLQTKLEIKEALNNVEQHYLPIFAIIDEKSKDRLDTPLHLTAYLLNPYYFYKDLSIFGDEVVSTGFTTFAEMYFPNNLDMQDIIVNIEFTKYSRKEGSFGKPLAAKGCLKNDDNYDPG